MSLWILSGCHSQFSIRLAHEYDTWAVVRATNILVKQSVKCGSFLALCLTDAALGHEIVMWPMYLSRRFVRVF